MHSTEKYSTQTIPSSERQRLRHLLLSLIAIEKKTMAPHRGHHTPSDPGIHADLNEMTR
ncbi:hypothetical protein AMATHDRAFT_70834 [Amanita thiersii Skay4041]|uniref:Uncharacterized protein n=1 Tax=Amanita thiersii Skay4041 TaxID=703135 RepID=A0A2A9N7D4_9AGAR|nr:hypothetical protein AMATHDRAFT_70834 [Amanita thiersii Skay4041]